MIPFRVPRRRLALVSVLVAVVVVGGISFATFSRGAHADTTTPNACADAGLASGCTVLYQAQYRSHSAEAMFSQSDNNASCPTTTATYVWAGETVQQVIPTGRTSGPAVNVQIYQADCNGFASFDAVGTSTDVTVTAPGTNLQSASAVATVPITDSISGTTIDVTVNLTWVGMGAVTRGIWNSHEQSPDRLVNFHQSGTYRTAIVSGNVVSGTTDYASGASALGDLSLNDSGTVSITR